MDIGKSVVQIAIILERTGQHFQTNRMSLVVPKLIDIVLAILIFAVFCPGHENTQGFESVRPLGHPMSQTLRCWLPVTVTVSRTGQRSN